MTSELLGPIALIAYAFAIVYFYRASAAVAIEFGTRSTHEERVARLQVVNKQIAELEQRLHGDSDA